MLQSSKQTINQKIDYLVGLLPRKGAHAFSNFVTCLESEKEHPAHQELADKLKSTATILAESQQQVLPMITYEAISEVSACMIMKSVFIDLIPPTGNKSV